MNNVVPFVPKAGLAAKAALREFVYWAKSQIHLYDEPLDPVQWEAESWHRWGLKNTACSRLGKRSETLHPEFIDYVKAMLFDERAVRLRKDSYLLNALRCLEIALLDIIGKADVTSANSSVFDRACAISQDYNSLGTAYKTSLQLRRIHGHLQSSGMVAKPFIWDPQIKEPAQTLKKNAEDARKKLPSEASLIALGEIFHSKPGLPLDIMTTSAVAIMLSQPSRVGELKYVKKDCFFSEKDSQGRKQLYMLWHSNKGFGPNKKPIPDSMVDICKEAVSRVVEITQEARDYAKWLEENPESFPPHAGVPNRNIDEPLSLQEVCDSLMLSTKNHPPRNVFKNFLNKIIASKVISAKAQRVAQGLLAGYDTSKGTRLYVNGRLAGFEFNDTWVVTLRTLNVLVREKYLSKHFPYTDAKRVVKWRDALFCFRTGAFTAAQDHPQKPFGLIGCCSHRLNTQLSGSQKNTQSIFNRHGYVDVKVNSHAFRHLLNTGAQCSGLSQELIARWSGRIDVTQNRVYNHMSIEEKTAEVETFTPQLSATNVQLLASLKTNAPISMRDLGDESDRIVHITEFGVCIHDYAQEPCAKFNNCLTCGEHVCVKGDETKLANLKDEREHLRISLVAFRNEADSGTYGANTWLQTTMEKMERCEQLIRVLEDPDIEDGAIIRGVENGWTSGRNALAMRDELVEENANFIETDSADDKVDELERLLGLGD
ncbi:hypothetical protein [Halomonas sp. M4R1S46]|uniref:hypothetical protein n=1 Tax=Halomonas sp. M4R1S46 TaxID=2982692 RepID=UPI0021E3AD08|nr:hypothetical protein [Halomonas sp. M4R1S46]UYG06862.1 hypothetical protein OCT48_14705 [Halomonas sp. M4R1S46]